MHTIALVSRKGGTGKSTLAIGLAVAAVESGHRVCLLEADPLGTVSNWRRRRTSAEPMVEIIHDGYALFHRVQALAQRGITLTIVDTAGGWSDACTGGPWPQPTCALFRPAQVRPTLTPRHRCLPPYAKAVSRSPSCSIKSKPVAPAFTVQRALSPNARSS
jgi:chromosome partitioning protein